MKQIQPKKEEDDEEFGDFGDVEEEFEDLGDMEEPEEAVNYLFDPENKEDLTMCCCKDEHAKFRNHNVEMKF